MSQALQPTRDEFATYWKDYGVFKWRQVVHYVVFLGGLAVYAFAVRRLDAEGRFWFLSLAGAAAYLVFLPYLWIRKIHIRNACFIRCPQCGDWFGQDSSGAYFGPNPKFQKVIHTGNCVKCGKQILAQR